MNGLEILRQMASLHVTMVRLAEHGQWNELAAAQKEQDILAASLQKFGGLKNLPETGESRKLVEAILAAQDEVRSYVVPWMEQVSPLLEAFSPPER